MRYAVNRLSKAETHKTNLEIEKLVSDKGTDPTVYLESELDFISLYSGSGGLAKDDDDASSTGLLYEFFTPIEVAEKMWAIIYAYLGTESKQPLKVLEPTVGTGRLLHHAPKNAELFAFEINPFTTKLTSILYPNITIKNASFESNFYKGNKPQDKPNEGNFDVVIMNPPYGEFKSYYGAGERKLSKAKNWNDYFIYRTLDVLKPGGIVVALIGAEAAQGGNLLLDRQINETKKMIFKKGQLVEAFKLPIKLFNQSNCSTEIVAFLKR